MIPAHIKLVIHQQDRLLEGGGGMERERERERARVKKEREGKEKSAWCGSGCKMHIYCSAS